jgi:hypothetical protein
MSNYLKGLNSGGIQTKAPCNWDVNKGGYVNGFTDRIPHSIVPFVDSNRHNS